MTKISFKYNGKIWNPKNPEKKLKQLGITWDDVEIIEESPQKKEEKVEYQDVQLYYFLNHATGYSITSIYPELDGTYISDSSDYSKCTKEELEKLWNSKK